MQYLALIHDQGDTTSTNEEWERFIQIANDSGMFRGGSALGARQIIGPQLMMQTADSVGGFMIFEAKDLESLLALLEQHPVIVHQGTIELCEMPET